MNSKTVDILIPVYNGEKYIEKCLNSILNQTYKDIRIVIVDDGSLDSTQKILNQFSLKNKNIEVFTKKNENNISKTRNFLLSKIQSNYFTFIDSDDYVEPTYIEELYNNLISYNADISICGKCRHNEKKYDSLEKYNDKQNSILIMNKEECIAEMLSSNLFNGTVYSKLFKTKHVQNVNFNPEIHYGEDLDFCFKIMQNCDKFVLSQKKLYHYIIRKNSIVTSKFKTSKLTCIDCYENIIDKVKNNEELFVCAKSMQGLIAIELLYYTWRDKFKDKQIKAKLKLMIKNSIPYIKKNKRLSKLLKCTPLVWKLTKIM